MFYCFVYNNTIMSLDICCKNNPDCHLNFTIDCYRQTENDLPTKEDGWKFPAQRIYEISVPLLMLCQPISKYISIGMGGLRLTTHLVGCAQAKQEQEMWKLASEASQVVLAGISFASFFLHVPMGAFVTTTADILQNLSAIIYHYREGKPDLVKDNLVQLVGSSFYMAVMLTGSAYILLALTVVQGTINLYQASKNWKGGKAPETLVQFVIASVRLYEAKWQWEQIQQCNARVAERERIQNIRKKLQEQETEKKLQEEKSMQEAHRIFEEEKKKTKPEILLTQAEWNHIYYNKIETARSSGELPQDMKSLLMDQGTSCCIQNIDFTKTNDLSNLVFQDISFQNCNFSGVNFDHSRFHNVTAEACQFNNSSWRKCELDQLFFFNCQLQNAAFFRSLLQSISMTDCDLSLSCFNNSIIKDLSVVRGKLLETSFLHAQVTKGKLIDSDLTDALLLDAKNKFKIHGGIPHRITKPIIALGWNFKKPGYYTSLIKDALRDNKTIPLLYEQRPPDIDKDKLNNEFRTKLSQILYPLQLSIPHEVLRGSEKDSEIWKTQKLAASILKYCDALAIPGGENVEKEFYQRVFVEVKDIRRSMLEFSALAYAEANKIPTMGTCRGAQLINVWRGGTLRDLDWQYEDDFDPMILVDSAHNQWLRQIVGRGLIGHSNHYQAVDKLGQHLHIVLKDHLDIPKFFVGEDGLLIASQIHPEWYVHHQVEINISIGKRSSYTVRKEEEEVEKFVPKKIFGYFDGAGWFDFKQKNREIYQYFVNLAYKRFDTRKIGENFLNQLQLSSRVVSSLINLLKPCQLKTKIPVLQFQTSSVST